MTTIAVGMAALLAFLEYSGVYWAREPDRFYSINIYRSLTT